MGYIAVCSHAAQPRPEDVPLRVVHRSLVRSGGADRVLWQSEGTSADVPLTLWAHGTREPCSIATGCFQVVLDLKSAPEPKGAAGSAPTCLHVAVKAAPSEGARGPGGSAVGPGGAPAGKKKKRMPGRWLDVRVFISSTFIDMAGERNVLVKIVFPEINERLKDRWVRLIPIDLRWGVLPEHTRRIQQSCLNEIDACRPPDADDGADGAGGGSDGLDAAPWFLALRGERYGWIQDPYVACLEFARPRAVMGWLEGLRERRKALSITRYVDPLSSSARLHVTCIPFLMIPPPLPPVSSSVWRCGTACCASAAWWRLGRRPATCTPSATSGSRHSRRPSPQTSAGPSTSST